MTNKKALATLAAQPWKISDMRNPSAEMEACALRRIPCMVYRNRQWKIDPEYVCPGITVWSKTFRDPDVTKNPDMTDQELLNSIADWMPFGALAFMPPSHIHLYLSEGGLQPIALMLCAPCTGPWCSMLR